MTAQELVQAMHTPKVEAKNGQLTTTSLNVAEVFGKSHKNVIQAIEKKIAEIPREFSRLNFQPTTYTDEQNKTNKLYIITKDGFSFLVMGFTGKKADTFKIAYINEFNRMRDELANQAKPKRQKALPKPKQLSITSKSSTEYQYPPHTQVLMNFTKDHNRLMHELYGLSMEICDDLAVLGRYPVCRARDRLASNPKVICFEQFIEGMISNDIRNLRKIAMNFRDEFWRLCDFYIMLSHMQGL